MTLRDYDAERLAAFTKDINAKYDELKARNLTLDLTRGKPSAEQLDFSNAILALPAWTTTTPPTAPTAATMGA